MGAELEKVKRANDGRRTPPATSDRPLQLQRMHGEALTKEIKRTRRRIELLDSKVELLLESEAQDLRQRADMVLHAMPDNGPEDSPRLLENSPHIAELKQLVASRETALQQAKDQEEQLHVELAAMQKALETANIAAAVMEQKMNLLHSREDV